MIRNCLRLALLGSAMVGIKAAAFTCADYLQPQLRQEEVNFLLAEAKSRLLENISQPGTVSGTVIASPSRANPDYYFHWTRDAALIMRHVDDRDLISKYIDLSLHHQITSTPSNSLGEPKFNVDGSAYFGPWGRPQNDGPALRALVVIPFAHALLNEGNRDYVTSKLYQTGLPNYSLIKRDLEYIAHHWRELSFDLWEEVFGLSIYTVRAQQRALRAGTELADRLNDGGAAAFYREQADEIGKKLEKFWNEDRGYLVAEIEVVSGPNHESGLDVAVILAANHFANRSEPFSPTDDRVMATAFHLQQRFARLYKINNVPDFGHLGTAIGRYPEDLYDGYNVGPDTIGNPWFLATNAFAEFCYRASSAYKDWGKIPITNLNRDFFASLRALAGLHLQAGTELHAGDGRFEQVLRALVSEGDRYIARVRHHMNLGHMSEQFNRDTGYMQGAQDLTWSYASLISALSARPTP